MRYTGSGVATFNGVSGGVNGQVLYLHNGSTSTLTLANQASADTSYANQIVTGTGSNLSVASNSAVILQYDASATNSNGASGAWRVIGGSGGSAIPAGTTGQVQYNSGSNTLAANNNLTFLTATNALVVGTGAATPQATSGTVASFIMNVIPQAFTPTLRFRQRRHHGQPRRDGADGVLLGCECDFRDDEPVRVGEQYRDRHRDGAATSDRQRQYRCDGFKRLCDGDRQRNRGDRFEFAGEA